MRLTRPSRRTSLYRFLALAITETLSAIIAIGTVALALKLVRREVGDVALLLIVAAVIGVYGALAALYIAPVGGWWEGE